MVSEVWAKEVLIGEHVTSETFLRIFLEISNGDGGGHGPAMTPYTWEALSPIPTEEKNSTNQLIEVLTPPKISEAH